MTGISLPTSGKISVLPLNFAYRSSRELTATAVSPSNVSGRVVATITHSFLRPSLTGYRMCQRWPVSFSCSLSSSDSAVQQRGHQLMM